MGRPRSIAAYIPLHVVVTRGSETITNALVEVQSLIQTEIPKGVIAIAPLYKY